MTLFSSGVIPAKKEGVQAGSRCTDFFMMTLVAARESGAAKCTAVLSFPLKNRTRTFLRITIGRMRGFAFVNANAHSSSIRAHSAPGLVRTRKSPRRAAPHYD